MKSMDEYDKFGDAVVDTILDYLESGIEDEYRTTINFGGKETVIIFKEGFGSRFLKACEEAEEADLRKK